MIVKNEEKVIERILSQIKKFADEIIIVDTGSIDNTKSICYKYTDLVFDFDWCDDFASARNFSFSKASKDYIMWLDADDYIRETEISKILELKKNNDNIDTYMFKYNTTFDENDNPTFSYYRERLLKRNNQNVWKGFVHEVITPKGKIKYLDITIEHRKLSVSNPKRNLQIYRKQLKMGFNLNAREQYYYFRELYYNGYYRKAIIEFKKYLKLDDPYTPNIIDAHIIVSNIYNELKDYKLTLKTLFDCIKKYLPTPEICCKIATTFEYLDNILQCIYWYEIALITPRQTQGFINIDTEKFIPYVELSRLYYNLNNYETAKKYFILSKECKPNHPSVIYNAKFFKK